MTQEQTRPQCVNHGCEKPVAHDGVRLRPVCSHCQKASYGGQPYAAGVTPYRTGRCRNQDGHLGFQCPIDYERSLWAVGMTEIDHRDGSNYNNALENLDELCPMCHKRKSHLNSDHQSRRYRKKVLTTETTSTIIQSSVGEHYDTQPDSAGTDTVPTGTELQCALWHPGESGTEPAGSTLP